MNLRILIFISILQIFKYKRIYRELNNTDKLTIDDLKNYTNSIYNFYTENVGTKNSNKDFEICYDNLIKLLNDENKSLIFIFKDVYGSNSSLYKINYLIDIKEELIYLKEQLKKNQKINYLIIKDFEFINGINYFKNKKLDYENEENKKKNLFLKLNFMFNYLERLENKKSELKIKIINNYIDLILILLEVFNFKIELKNIKIINTELFNKNKDMKEKNNVLVYDLVKEIEFKNFLERKKMNYNLDFFLKFSKNDNKYISYNILKY